MIKSDLYGALSRGYCSEKNRSKTVDPDLIEAMADELLLLYCKTQGKLFEEKHCPYEQVSHGIGLDNNDDSCLNIKDFQRDLEKIINCHSKENTSNTPDWVIASYLVRCLDAFDDCINLRERYYGRQLIKEPIPIVKPSETLTAKNTAFIGRFPKRHRKTIR